VPYAVVSVLMFGFVLYCVLDLVLTDESRVRNLPKLVWLLLIVIVPLIGGIAWLVGGRPEGADAGLERRHLLAVPREPALDSGLLRGGLVVPSSLVLDEPCQPRQLGGCEPRAHVPQLRLERLVAVGRLRLPLEPLGAWRARVLSRVGVEIAAEVVAAQRRRDVGIPAEHVVAERRRVHRRFAAPRV
jgi:hypothetical protein